MDPISKECIIWYMPKNTADKRNVVCFSNIHNRTIDTKCENVLHDILENMNIFDHEMRRDGMPFNT